ncbi:MAG: hypothetical protein C0513_08635 [Isosphaera sp.]|nr:hypothetical protein [Isosphaera sp.]
MAGDALMLSVSGCRGVVGSTLTPEVIARFAGAVGTWARARVEDPGRRSVRRPVVVLGNDGRSGGQLVAQVASATLAMTGCDVLDLGVAMTPTVGFVVDRLGADAGLVATASHNPQEWNGLKPIIRGGGNHARGAAAARRGAAGGRAAGGPNAAARRAAGGPAEASAPSRALSEQIIGLYRAGSPGLSAWAGQGSVVESTDDLGDRHARHVIGLLDGLGVLRAIKRAKLSAVVDNLGMSGAVLGPGFLHELGVSAHPMHDAAEVGGVFPHTPEPVAENLRGLCREVKKRGASVGFAQDPDGDRLALVDERGRFIGEEYTVVLAARALGELGKLGSTRTASGRGKGTPTLCVNLSTSRMIEDVAARYGARVVRAPVGEANVVEAMRAHGSPIGGEGNGGVIWPQVTYIRDSIGAMGLVLALMAHTGLALSELVAQLPAYAIVKRKVELLDRKGAARAGAAVARALGREVGASVDEQDGVRVELPVRRGRADGGAGDGGGGGGRGWVHVRASNTEPIMRLIAEAPTRATAEALLARAEEAIRGS